MGLNKVHARLCCSRWGQRRDGVAFSLPLTLSARRARPGSRLRLEESRLRGGTRAAAEVAARRKRRPAGGEMVEDDVADEPPKSYA